jgi:hypothetical protein
MGGLGFQLILERLYNQILGLALDYHIVRAGIFKTAKQWDQTQRFCPRTQCVGERRFHACSTINYPFQSDKKTLKMKHQMRKKISPNFSVNHFNVLRGLTICYIWSIVV